MHSVQGSRIATDNIKSFVQDLLQNGRLDGKGGLSVKTVSDILVVLKDILHYTN